VGVFVPGFVPGLEPGFAARGRRAFGASVGPAGVSGSAADPARGFDVDLVAVLAPAFVAVVLAAAFRPPEAAVVALVVAARDRRLGATGASALGGSPSAPTVAAVG
jgi:hypothetical protein